MMNSKQRPYSMHKLEKRVCLYCSEIYYAHHGLQRYCPEKFGKKDYCKYAQKKMVEEKRLAERVVELSKTGMSVREETPLEKNNHALTLIMGSDEQKTVEGTLLDLHGYDIHDCAHPSSCVGPADADFIDGVDVCGSGVGPP